MATLPGGPVVRVTGDHHSFAPVWGPSGIAYSRECCVHGDIWLMRPDGTRVSRRVAILYDMLAVDDFRRLRVLLRLGKERESNA